MNEKKERDRSGLLQRASLRLREDQTKTKLFSGSTGIRATTCGDSASGTRVQGLPEGDEKPSSGTRSCLLLRAEEQGQIVS